MLKQILKKVEEGFNLIVDLHDMVKILILMSKDKPERVSLDDYFILDKAADFCKVSTKTFYRYVKDLDLPYIKVGGSRYFKKTVIEAAIRDNLFGQDKPKNGKNKT